LFGKINRISKCNRYFLIWNVEPYHFVHKTLECLSSISQTERHSHVFKKAERCRDGRLRNIFFRHQDLLIGADQVNFGEDRPAAQLRDEVVYVGDRVSVGLRHVVEASIISTWAPGVRGDAQLLLDGRMMPRSSRMSNSFLASSSRSGGNRRGLAKTGGPCVRMWCCMEWVASLLVLKHDVMIRSVTDN
ncbi:hypothetical protein T12_14770, partial [Trichinella patagoniensis]